MDKKMKDFICVAIAFITTIASLQFYIIEGESCLFVDPLMFHNNMVFYEAINGLSRFLLPVT